MRTLLAISAMFAAVAGSTGSAAAATIDLSTLNQAGSATMAGSALQLTHTSSVSNASGVSGAAWLTQGVSTASSFSTSFSFSLKGNDSGSMADGITLAFQNIGTGVTGVGGGDVGYWNMGGSGSSGVGSVIRTWNNNDYGLSTNGTVQNLKSAGWDLGAANYVTGNETVSYNATTHVLTMSGVFYDMSTATPTAHEVSDSKIIDLGSKFGGTMYVGFTGGTAGTDADQRITSFSISAVPEADTYAMLLAGLGMVGLIGRRRKRR
jgi:hypothetical protein